MLAFLAAFGQRGHREALEQLSTDADRYVAEVARPHVSLAAVLNANDSVWVPADRSARARPPGAGASGPSACAIRRALLRRIGAFVSSRS